MGAPALVASTLFPHTDDLTVPTSCHLSRRARRALCRQASDMGSPLAKARDLTWYGAGDGRGARAWRPP